MDVKIANFIGRPPRERVERGYHVPRMASGSGGEASGGGGTLVLHPGALGDVLQAVPALRRLRALGPVTLAAQPRIAHLLRGADEVDAALDVGALGTGALFVEDGVDARLDAQLHAHARVVSWFGASDASYAARLGARAAAAVVAPPVPTAGARPVWQHLADTVELLAGSRTLDRRPLSIPEGWRLAAARRLAALGLGGEGPTLLVHPGAGGAAKRWPAAKLAAVVVAARALATPRGPLRVLVHRGPADGEAAAELLAELEPETPTLVEPGLGELAGVLSLVTAYLGADSGVSHLAAAVGARGAIVFTPALRDRWQPWGATGTVTATGHSQADVGAAGAAIASALG
jgi:ADP-heptose:LPS heptosyltransferase